MSFLSLIWKNTATLSVVFFTFLTVRVFADAGNNPPNCPDANGDYPYEDACGNGVCEPPPSGEVCCDEDAGITASSQDDCDNEPCDDGQIPADGEECCDVDGDGLTEANPSADCPSCDDFSLDVPPVTLCEFQTDFVLASGGTAPYSFSSSDSSIVSVSSNGLVTGGSVVGTATITVTDDTGCSESVSVTVEEKFSCETDAGVGTLNASGAITLVVGDYYTFNSNL